VVGGFGIAADYPGMSRLVTGMLIFLASIALAAPSTATAATRAFEASADATVSAAKPSRNHGRGDRLVVGRGHAAYLRFDVSLPAGAEITGARLRLHTRRRARSRATLLRTGNGWTERTLRWQNRPAAVSVVARGRRMFAIGAVAAGGQSFLLRSRAARPTSYRSREGRHAPRLIVTFTITLPSQRTPAATGCPVATPQTTWRTPGSPPLSDAEAAACVSRSGENRPQNAGQNAKAPTPAELTAFHAARDTYGRAPAQYNPNFAFVTGAAALHGLRSTDDIIEWAAYKWGIPEDFVRGQMVMESGWSMLQKGDRRDWPEPISTLYPAPAVIDIDSVWESLGIAQIRWRHTVPWNPGVEPLRWQSTGFALDYSQALIRYYYDGYCDWCGAGYAAGDADGAYRSYVSGSWNEGQSYADGVRANAASKPWLPIPPP
jgi:hypothetical protein